MRDAVMTTMRVLHVSIEDRQDFAARYLSEPPHGGMVIHSAEALLEGDLVEVRLQLRDEDRQVGLRGLVLWRRESTVGDFNIGIGFLSTEAVKREELLRGLASRDAAVDRREPRFPITLKVTYETSTDFIIDYTRNISSGGLFISSRSMPALGTDILFKLYPPGEPEPIELQGRVAWHKPGQGFGVRFREGEEQQQRKLASLVENVSMGASSHPTTGAHPC